VQTTAEKWTTQDYRCVQRDEVNLWPATEPLPLYRSDPFQKALPASTCKRQTRTPAMMLSKENTMRFSHGTISSAWTRERYAEWVSYLCDRIPLKRPGQPGDLDAPVVFLASEASRYITGQTLLVDGGISTGATRATVA